MEGTLVKVIRLVANLITEETVGALLKSHTSQIQKIVRDLCVTVKSKSLEQSEEFILNSISFLTNLLFYDTPGSPLIEELAVKHNVRLREFLDAGCGLLFTGGLSELRNQTRKLTSSE